MAFKKGQSGNPKGRQLKSKNKVTIEKEEARKQFQQMVLQRLKPLFESQMTLARGVSYMYRIIEHSNGAREHVIVEDPDEIGDVLAQMDEEQKGVYNDSYYYITTKAPENKAIDSMLDRVWGKATQAIGGEAGKAIEVTITKYADKPAAPIRT